MGTQTLGDVIYEREVQDQRRAKWLLHAAKIAEEMHNGGHNAGHVAAALRKAAADKWWRDRVENS